MVESQAQFNKPNESQTQQLFSSSSFLPIASLPIPPWTYQSISWGRHPRSVIFSFCKDNMIYSFYIYVSILFHEDFQDKYHPTQVLFF